MQEENTVAEKKYNYGPDRSVDRNDPGQVMAQLEKHPQFFKLATHRVQNMPDVALAAVQRSGWNLEWVGEELKKDPVIVTAAVNNEGRALQFAHYSLRADPDIVFAAIRQNPLAAKYAQLSPEDAEHVKARLAALPNIPGSVAVQTQGAHMPELMQLSPGTLAL